jgi:HK97 family phage prohead protease
MKTLKKDVPVSGVKAGPDDGLAEGEFLAYPATFTKTPDSYGDVIAKGAFADTITKWKDSGDVMPGMYLHDPNQIVASATDMGEDDHGWWVKGKFDDDPPAQRIYNLLKGRRLSSLSFAYDVVDEGKAELDDGTTANELRKVNAHEFSFLPKGFAANDDTSVVDVKDAFNARFDVSKFPFGPIPEELLKSGRVLAAKHITKLKNARDALTDVIAAAEAADEPKSDKPDEKTSAPCGAADSPDDEASAARPANDEETPGAGSKSEEPSGATPVQRLAANTIDLLAMGGKEVQS